MDETPLVTGPVFVVHEVLGALKLQVGAPVGASEPFVPVIVAV